MAKKTSGAKDESPRGDRVVAQNRRAFYDYFIEETIETGIVLTGSEIKSIREGKITIGEGYVRVENGELWLIGAHISPFKHGGYANHDPDRPRKLLAHKHQIAEFREGIERKGLTVVPLRVRMKNSRAKVDIGLARGKKLYDKRQGEMERDAKRDMERVSRGRE